jgi:hypothetical protein
MPSRLVKLTVLFLAAAVVFSRPAVAQQITYYDFDALVPPVQTGPPLIYSYSYLCGSSVSSSTLFCFNNQSGGALTSYPALFQDTYPANVDPNPSDNQPLSSTHTTLQVSDGQDEYASAWFAVPQKVLNGFTTYVAFRLAPPCFACDAGRWNRICTSERLRRGDRSKRSRRRDLCGEWFGAQHKRDNWWMFRVRGN